MLIADIILHNGVVLTFDAATPRASAIAIVGDRIVRVGGPEIARQWQGPTTKVIDLEGRCAIPGFNDVHAHMEREGLKRQRPSLSGARSVEEILARVRLAAAN